MPLTETIEFHSVTINEFGHIHVRADDVVRRGDGEEMSRRAWRMVVAPGEDLSAITDPHFEACRERVSALAAADWTPERIEDYQEIKAAVEAVRAAKDAGSPQVTVEVLAPLNANVEE